MPRRGPPPKGHKARARKGVAVAGGRAARIAAASKPAGGGPRARRARTAPDEVLSRDAETPREMTRRRGVTATRPGPPRGGAWRRGVADDEAPRSARAARRGVHRSAPRHARDKAARNDITGHGAPRARRRRRPSRATRGARHAPHRAGNRGIRRATDDARRRGAPRRRATRRPNDIAPRPSPRRAARRRAAARPAEPPPLPSKTELRAYLARARGRVGKSDIARHFGLFPDQRQALRALMREVAADGGATPAGKRGIIAPDKLPEIAPVEITGTDPDGDPIARPLQWQGEGRPPVIYMHPEPRGQRALTAGERVLARLKPVGPGKYEGRTFKRIAGAPPARILGVFEEGRIIPTDRRQKGIWEVPRGEEAGAKPGEIVLAEPLPSTRHFGAKPARIVERLVSWANRNPVSLVCIHAHGIPDVFPPRRCSRPNARAVWPRSTAPTCATSRWSRSTAPMRATSTTRSSPNRIRRLAHPGRDRRCRALRHPAPRSTVRPGRAAIPSISPTASCPCCPRRCRMAGARCARTKTAAACSSTCASTARHQAVARLRPRHHAVGRAAHLRTGAGGGGCAGGPYGAGCATRCDRRRRRAAWPAPRATAPSPADTLPEGHIARLYGAFRALLGAREKRGTLDLDVPERKVVLDAHGRVAEVAPARASTRTG